MIEIPIVILIGLCVIPVVVIAKGFYWFLKWLGWNDLSFERRYGNVILKWALKWNADGCRVEDFEKCEAAVSNLIRNVSSNPKWINKRGFHQPDLYIPDRDMTNFGSNPPKGHSAIKPVKSFKNSGNFVKRD